MISIQENKHQQMSWILQITGHFTHGIAGSTRDDINYAICRAADAFTRGDSAANAIYQGYDLARSAIRLRQQAPRRRHGDQITVPGAPV